MNRSAAIVVGSAVAALIAIVGLRYAASERPAAVPPALVGILREAPAALPDFELRDHNGAAFGRAELHGRWTLLFFGYTSCPDICPTTMLTLRELAAELRRRGDPLPQVVLVSVDPARDGAEQLARYVAHFDPAFVGATGSDDQLRALAVPVGAMYERDAPGADGAYQVAHSASIFLVDPEARALAAFSPPHQPATIADQLATIRARRAPR